VEGGMITVNNQDFEWRNGLTVEGLLENLKKTRKYKEIIETRNVTVLINGKLIPTDEYDRTAIHDQDLIHLFSFLSGG
jgi:thiamine biosynthesis protein ThiS